MPLKNTVRMLSIAGLALAASGVSATADSWNGFYAGISAGLGRSPTAWTSGSVDVGSFTSGGAIGGVQLGYNWQKGNIVAGLEADYLASNIKSTSTCVNILTCGDKINGLGSVRGRLGWAATPTALIYFTAGLGFGKTTHTAALGAMSNSVNTSGSGLAFGGGGEFKIDKNWSLKGEYLHYNLGTMSDGESIPTYFKTTADTFKLGLNYKF